MTNTRCFEREDCAVDIGLIKMLAIVLAGSYGDTRAREREKKEQKKKETKKDVRRRFVAMACNIKSHLDHFVANNETCIHTQQ